MKNKKRDIEKRAKILLWEHNLDVSKLARKIGISRTWTSQVLYGHARSELTRKKIARILGEYLWKGKAA